MEERLKIEKTKTELNSQKTQFNLHLPNAKSIILQIDKNSYNSTSRNLRNPESFQ